MALQPTVIDTLREAQRVGFFGSRAIEEAVEHATAFTTAIRDRGAEAERIVDIGSGGGLPGLVIADALPHCELLLIDRRQKRTDFLQRAVSRLGWSHVSVRCGDVGDLASEVEMELVSAFGVVTARGFGPPELTLRLARRLVVSGGLIVISEPPDRNRWRSDLVGELGLSIEHAGAVRVFRRS